MNQFLPSHLHYKPLNLVWLKKIPDNWRLLRGKQIFKTIDIRSETGEEELLSVSSKFGIVPRKDANVTMFKAQSYIGYKMCWPNDLVINSIWAWAQGLGVSRHHGIISSAYGVYRIKEESVADPRFIHYLVRSTPFQWELQVRSKGIWTSRLQLSDWSFLDIPFPLPPIDEQQAIVKYLDYVDTRVKKYIRAKQKQIKLLEEMKQAIIHQAVTRGLDPTIPLKPSGVAWLGDVPEHWDILPGKLCIHEKKTPNIGNKISKVLSLSYGKIVERPEEKLHGLVPSSFETYQIIQENDIIVRSTDMQNDHVSWRFGLCTQEGIITSAYLCLQAIKVITAKFAYYVLHNYDITKDIYRFGSGLRQNLSWTDFKYLPIIVPPMNEQIQIAEHLDDIDYKCNQISVVLKTQINLMKQLRDRLVADIVTGKLDIREAANQLPNEIEDLLEEPDEAFEEDLENGEELEEAIPEEE